MRNNVNTAITRALLAVARDRKADVGPLLEMAEYPAELLERPGRYVSNETFIVLMAQARQLLADPRVAQAVGGRVAQDLALPELRPAPGLGLEAAKIEPSLSKSLGSLFLQLRFAVSAVGPHRLRVEVGRKDDSLYTHDHCLFLQGFIERTIAIFGGELEPSGEDQCLVTVDRVGELASGRYRIDDEGRIWRTEASDGRRAELEEEIGAVNPDQSHQVDHVIYGADRCAYRFSWRNPHTRSRRMWAATFGRGAQFGRALLALETGKSHPAAYAAIVQEWRRWLQWEPSYLLTRLKYLSHLALIAVAALFALAATIAWRGSTFGLAAVPLVAAAVGLCHLVTRAYLGHARQLIKRREDTEKFLQSASVGVSTIRSDYTIEYANPLIQDLHGPVEGRKCHEVFRWETAPCADCPLQAAFVHGRPVQAELKYFNRDGGDVWLHVNATPLGAEAGRVASVITVSTDVTIKKTLELELSGKRSELEASESRYRGFMAHAADAILITGPGHEILEANHKTLELLGIESIEPFVGVDLFETPFVAAKDRPRLRELFSRMVSARAAQSFEARIVSREGGPIEVEAQAVPILERDQVVGVQSILRDVTARKQEEFETRLLLSMSNSIKNASNLKAMVKHALEGLCAMMQAPVGAIFLRQPEQRRLELAALVGTSASVMQKLAVAAVDGSATDVARRETILRRTLVINDIEELKLGREDKDFLQKFGVTSAAGVPMLVEDQLQGLIYIAAGSRECFGPKRLAVLKQVANELAVGIGRQRLNDLVQEKNRELVLKNQEIQNATVQLFQSEKMASVGLLAAGVAHEINNPMGYITSNLNLLKVYRQDLMRVIEAHQGLVQTLERDAPAPILKSAIDRVNQTNRELDLPQLLIDVNDTILESIEGAERVTLIVQGLREFSHPETKEARWADLRECLESTVKIVWNELKYKCEVVKEYGELPEIKCYPQELKQVFMNLLVNAAQAIPVRGEIRLRTYRQDDWAVAEIKDTGEGMTPDQLTKIFDPFYTTKEVGKGTGLGLAISYGIIQKHHGLIEVQSEPGHGATFTIKLPITPNSDSDLEPAPPDPDRQVLSENIAPSVPPK